MFEDVTKKALEAVFDQGFLGVLLVLSWLFFAYAFRWLNGLLNEAKAETKAERADHRATIAKQMEDIRNLAKVPTSFENMMPIIEMVTRNQKSG